MKGKTAAALMGSLFAFVLGYWLVDTAPMTAFGLGWCSGGLIVHVHRDLKEPTNAD